MHLPPHLQLQPLREEVGNFDNVTMLGKRKRFLEFDSADDNIYPLKELTNAFRVRR